MKRPARLIGVALALALIVPTSSVLAGPAGDAVSALEAQVSGLVSSLGQTNSNVTALQTQVATLQAQVAALQPSPSPTPSPTPPPASGPLTITTSGTVIDGAVINLSGTTAGMGINVAGTAASPVANVTIRNCTITGGLFGIYATHVTNLVVQNCRISDVGYAAIAGYSWVGGQVIGNVINRVGTTKDPINGFQGNNAYGITLDRNHTGNLATDPLSSDVTIDHNTVEDVPLWMCINLHAGVRVSITNNTTGGCPRAVFVAGDGDGNQPSAVTITGNTILRAVTKSGGTTDLESVLYSHLTGGSVTANQIGQTYGSMPFDYQGVSTGVTVSGNVQVAG